MIFFIAVVTSIIFFAIGFLVGNFKEEPQKVVQKVKLEIENEQLAREYQNFLNYDGTEQF